VPELPEVETIRRGLEPHLLGCCLAGARVRQPRLRWPVPRDLAERLAGTRVAAVERRAKYLLVRTGTGTLLLHLGMTGSLRVVSALEPPGPHDHLDVLLGEGQVLRFTDSRRFGAVLWVEGQPREHALLRDLGPEPLGEAFDGEHLFRLSRGRRGAVKPFLMDQRIVVGVGNIYAAEALFLAGVDPRRAAGRISRERYRLLTSWVRSVLVRAIEQGGTTLGEFTAGEGTPGYFRQELAVYGRGDESCLGCGRALLEVRLGGRGTVFCPRCQR